MSEYGLPYMGSKSSICNELIKVFPSRKHFYDLFGGGFSVTHAMILRRYKDFERFHYNEIKPGISDLIKKAIAGEYNYNRFLPKFIDRKEFYSSDDPYVKIVWSFGNDQSGYIFSKEIEHYKKSMHNAIVFNEFDDLAKKVFGFEKFQNSYSVKQKRLFFRNKIGIFIKNGIPDFLLPFLNENQLRLERLQQLEQLERLQQLERLRFSRLSYERIKIESDSIVYCDPPYKETAGYGIEFDRNSFLNWADKQDQPVFISEYEIKDERFVLVFEIEKRSLFSSQKKECKIKKEKVFVNKSGKKLLLEMGRK